MARAGTLDKLAARHKLAIRMRIEGFSNKEIAEAAEVTERTLWGWWADPKVIDEIDRLQESANTALIQRMGNAAARAIETLVEIATSERESLQISDTQRMKAATEILDRTPSTVRTLDRERIHAEAGSSGTGDTNNVMAFIGQLPDEVLAKSLARFAQGNDGDIDGTAT